jgi:hypothetical protein
MNISIGVWPSWISVRSVFLLGLVVVAVSFPFSVAFIAAFRMVLAVIPRQEFRIAVPMALGVAILLHFGVFSTVAWLVHRALRSQPSAARAKAMMILAFLYTVAVFVAFVIVPIGSP